MAVTDLIMPITIELTIMTTEEAMVEAMGVTTPTTTHIIIPTTHTTVLTTLLHPPRAVDMVVGMGMGDIPLMGVSSHLRVLLAEWVQLLLLPRGKHQEEAELIGRRRGVTTMHPGSQKVQLSWKERSEYQDLLFIREFYIPWALKTT